MSKEVILIYKLTSLPLFNSNIINILHGGCKDYIIYNIQSIINALFKHPRFRYAQTRTRGVDMDEVVSSCRFALILKIKKCQTIR